MGRRNIANVGEEVFLIETPPKHSNAALTGDATLPPPPKTAQIVGTVTFGRSERYESIEQWQQDREKHRVVQGCKLDWTGDGEMHAWHVSSVRRFQTPVPAGSKTQTGYPTPRALRGTFANERIGPRLAPRATSCWSVRIPL